MSNMITYTSLFSEELYYDKETKVRVNSVVIPKIQRPYAQGRPDAVSTNVRDKFLSEIFRVLCADQEEILDLNFIYGTVVNQGAEGYSLELLDGQQRMTTLFLLYWYISTRELDEDSEEYQSVCDALSKFSYETRSSSNEFCRHLSEYKPNLSEYTPSKVIKKAHWYYKSYDKDSTIPAMLLMLDAIHLKYCKRICKVGLYPRMSRLQFYVLSLGQFDLSEELYVKMNARGLPLSSFENFKADMLDYVSSHEMSEDQVLEFSTSLDTRWIDIFWNKKNELFDTSYLSFFYRYFAARYLLDHAEISPEEMRKDPTIAFFYTDAEKTVENEYWGFKNFANQIEWGKSIDIDYIVEASSLLNVLLENKAELTHSLSPVWEKDSVNDFFCNKSATFNHVTLVVWASVVEYVRLIKHFDIKQLRQWIRIVTNILENSNIDSLEPTTAIARILAKMLEYAAPQINGIGNNGEKLEPKTLYAALASYDISGVVRRAVVEEVNKCAFIADDSNWENVFVEAESHPFLKGMIGFYIVEGMSIKDFQNRTAVVFSMLDEAGITEKYRKSHLLIRAIVSQISSWDDLKNKYITESIDTTKYLKNLIAGNSSIHSLFQTVAGLSSENEISIALESETTKSVEFKCDTTDSYWVKLENQSISRLRTDVRLYDWISKVEGKKKCRVCYSNGVINIARPNAVYDRIVIDCERGEIIKTVIKDYNLEFEYEAQNAIEEYGDVLCYSVRLERKFNFGVLYVDFADSHNLYLSYRAYSKDNTNTVLSLLGDGISMDPNDANRFIINSSKYDFMENYDNISTLLKQAIEKIQNVEETLEKGVSDESVLG